MVKEGPAIFSQDRGVVHGQVVKIPGFYIALPIAFKEDVCGKGLGDAQGGVGNWRSNQSSIASSPSSNHTLCFLPPRREFSIIFFPRLSRFEATRPPTALKLIHRFQSPPVRQLELSFVALGHHMHCRPGHVDAWRTGHGDLQDRPSRIITQLSGIWTLS